MRTLDNIITKASTTYGAPMGRNNIGDRGAANLKNMRIFDCAVPMDNSGAYDKGGVYWGVGKQLRVSYTKDLSYIQFYRLGELV